MRRVYPREIFSPVWDLLSDLSTSGVVASIDQVLEELKKQDDDILEWSEDHAGMFLPLDGPIQMKAKEILREFPDNFVDLRKRKSGADPFVVAAAVVEGAAVVTEEKKSGGPHKVKIPDVCVVFDVECFPLLELLRREDLRL